MAPKRKRSGLPKPDPTRPGHWIPINRQSDPHAFRTSDEQAELVARLSPTSIGARFANTAPPASDEGEKEKTASEPDDDKDSTYEPGSKRIKTGPKSKVRKPAQAADVGGGEDREVEGEGERFAEELFAEEADPAVEEEEEAEEAEEAEEVEGGDGDEGDEGDGEEEGEDDSDVEDALPLDSTGWRVGNEKTQPLTFVVRKNLTGGTMYKTINFEVDFSDNQSINKANKSRRQILLRANKKIGAPLKRPSMQDREYTQQNDIWIAAEYGRYAGANNNRRMPFDEFVQAYRAQFPTPPNQWRMEASLNSHIDRIPALKDMRANYLAF